MSADKVIGLVRVSQRDDDTGQSPDVQRGAMIGFAKANGWKLDEDDTHDENVDNGKVRKVSGTWQLAQRPRLLAAVEAIEAGTHQILLAEHWDRLFRNLDVQREVIRRVEAKGGQVWSVSQGQLTHSGQGKLVATVMGAMNEHQADEAKRRSWKAVEVAIQKGRVPGPVPPGYRRTPVEKGGDGVFVLGPLDEVQVVRDAFDLRDGGASTKDVREFLAANGIERTVTGVRKMLASRLYLGEIHYSGKDRPDDPDKPRHTPNLNAHPAIIDRDVFERVQKKVVSAGRKAKSERLLARLGVLRCGSCGGRMAVSNTGTRVSRGSGYVFYRCASDECTRKVTISADLIEKAVIAKVIEFYEQEGLARGAQKAREAEEAYEKARKTHADFVAILDPSEPSHVNREARLRSDRDGLKERADRLGEAVPAVKVTDVEKTFASGSLEAQRALVRSVIERVEVMPGRGSGRVVFIDLV